MSRRKQWWTAGALTVTVVIALIWYFAVYMGGESQRIDGYAVLTDPETIEVTGTTCTGAGDFDEFREGGSIFVGAKDSAVGEFWTGEYTDGVCSFRFIVSVKESDVYSFRVDGVDELTVDRDAIETTSEGGKTTMKPRLKWS